MKKEKAVVYAQLAMCLDTEGCIGGYRNQHKGYSVLIDVAQKDGRLVDWLSGNFGGRIHEQVQQTYYGRDVHLYHWVLGGPKAAYHLKRALPYLRVKLRQAELVIRLQSRIEHGKGKGYPLSDHEVEVRDGIVAELHELKSVFAPSKVAVETKRSRVGNDDAIVHPNGNSEPLDQDVRLHRLDARADAARVHRSPTLDRGPVQ